MSYVRFWLMLALAPTGLMFAFLVGMRDKEWGMGALLLLLLLPVSLLLMVLFTTLAWIAAGRRWPGSRLLIGVGLWAATLYVLGLAANALGELVLVAGFLAYVGIIMVCSPGVDDLEQLEHASSETERQPFG